MAQDVSDTVIGLPLSLRAMDVTVEMIPRMVEGALKGRSAATHPRPVTREDSAVLPTIARQ